jgi:pimeloyl-ACP methyl ester carboxylesterase
LVAWGERDPFIESAFADRYGARLPQATVEHVAGAGHWPWLDQPDLVERVVAFLRG